MSYAGPVFPLALREENAAISAQRNITMDFAPWVPVWISNEEEFATRTDLTEDDRQDFMETYNEWYPEGGRYVSSGDILVSDSYTLTNDDAQEQIVRILYPFASSLNSLEETRPTLTIAGEILETKLHIGSYAGGFQGVMGKGFSIREADERGYGVPYYLIVVGDDIENISYQGYATGGWDTKETVASGVTVTRSESDLETALRVAAAYYYQELVDAGNYFESEMDYGFELYYGLMKEHLMAYGLLSENVAARYDGGSIEELDVVGVARICWLEAEITIPAGESVILDAAFEKEPSFDFHCAASENTGVSGYDLVTALGSDLAFTRQTAKLEDRGQIEIVRQNFGFDLANRINEVDLDLTKPHYYLEVRKRQTD